jgi:hypothetical protein
VPIQPEDRKAAFRLALVVSRNLLRIASKIEECYLTEGTTSDEKLVQALGSYRQELEEQSIALTAIVGKLQESLK